MNIHEVCFGSHKQRSIGRAPSIPACAMSLEQESARERKTKRKKSVLGSVFRGGGAKTKGDLEWRTYVLLHSPIRVVYRCMQGLDSRLPCRICNNTVHSWVRAARPSGHRRAEEEEDQGG